MHVTVENVCYLVAVVAAVVLVVLGFTDLLKPRQGSETTDAQVISRQLRGLALVMLAVFVLVVGSTVCAFTGGLVGGLRRR